MQRWFYIIFEQKCPNLKPFLSITFPQGFRIYIKFGHGLLKVGVKRMLNGVNKWRRKKPVKKNFFAAAISHHFWAKNSNQRPLLYIIFPKGFRISKNFGLWTLGSGRKNTVKTEWTKCDGQTNKQIRNCKKFCKKKVFF